MSLRRTIEILVLTGLIAITSYFSAGCTRATNQAKKQIEQERTVIISQKQEQPIYGIAGKNIDEVLDYTQGIIRENPEEFKDYILDISKIGVDNGYDKEISDMFSDELLEKRISEMPNERKFRIIKPLIDEKVRETYKKILTFAEEQKPGVKEFYKNLERKVNDYQKRGEE